MLNPTILSTGAEATGNMGVQLISSLLIIALPLLVLYLFMIRPQKKKDKQIAKMRNSLIVGDEVTTIGGIVGRVVQIKDDVITIETGSDKSKIRMQRWAINSKETKVSE